MTGGIIINGESGGKFMTGDLVGKTEVNMETIFGLSCSVETLR